MDRGKRGRTGHESVVLGNRPDTMHETLSQITRVTGNGVGHWPLRFYGDRGGTEYRATGRVYLDDGVVCVDIAPTGTITYG